MAYNKRSIWFITISIAFFIIGFFLIKEGSGQPALTWMYLYDWPDFTSLNDLIRFILTNRTGTPPLPTVIEVGIYLITGSTVVITKYIYLLAFLLAFYLPLLAWRDRPLRLIMGATLSLFLLKMAFLVHSANPQIYDLYFPLLLLTFGYCLKKAIADQKGVWWLGAGLALSAAELTRPFMIYLLIPLLLLLYLYSRRFHLRPFIWLFIPILLLSGGWHLKLLLTHQQFNWSNYGGYNLWRAWEEAGITPPPLEPEPGPAIPGRWNDLNNDIITRNSRRLEQSITSFIGTHPQDFIKQGAKLSLLFFSIPTFTDPSGTTPNGFWPHHPLLSLYRIIVFILLILPTVNLILLGKKNIRAKMHTNQILNELIFTFILFGFGLFVALGEKGEQSRYIVSMLPLLLLGPIWIMNKIVLRKQRVD